MTTPEYIALAKEHLGESQRHMAEWEATYPCDRKPEPVNLALTHALIGHSLLNLAALLAPAPTAPEPEGGSHE